MITIPYPPTLNTYWRNVKGRVLISKQGREYRKQAITLAVLEKWPKYGDSRVRVVVTAYMPDKRRRDLDNLTKAVFDSLTHAGVWADDSQVDDFRIIRGPVEKPGRLEVEINVI